MNDKKSLDKCPNCGRNSIFGIHARSTGRTRALLHNYQCNCGYDTGNFYSDSEAKKQLKDDQAAQRGAERVKERK